MERKQQWVLCLIIATASLVGIFQILELDMSPVQFHKTISTDDTERKYQLPRHSATNRWVVIALESVRDVDISYLDNITGWKIVVVGKLPYLDGCRIPKCTYIHPGNVQGLRFRSVIHVSEDGYQLKNIAYLYAMLHKADVIYDLKYGVKPYRSRDNFIFTGTTHGLIYKENTTLNYYGHFGQPYLYPKGFPTKEKTTSSMLYDLCVFKSPPVQLGLISGESPLYDYQRKKLIHISKDAAPYIEFDTVAPPVFVPPGKVSVLSAGNIVFTRTAFWAMLLPVDGSVFFSGLLRGYITQRLLWETGDFVGIMGVTGILTTGKYVPSTDSDASIENKTNLLAEKLNKWTCDSQSSLFVCFKHLVNYFIELGILSPKNSNYLQSWLYDINALIPKVSRSGWWQSRKYVNEETCTTAHFSPDVNGLVVYNLESMSVDETTPWNGRPMCPDTSEVVQALKNKTRPKYSFPDVLLIVEINYSKLYRTINTVEKIYRRYFPNILYCGPSSRDFLNNQGYESKNVSHVEGVKDGWFYMYDCVSYAMKMNYKVRGYLHIGDDTLLHLWNLHSLPRDSVWFNKNLRMYNRSILSHPWVWWRLPEGRHNFEKVFTELREISQTGQEDAHLADLFFTNYIRNKQSLDFMFASTCDFYYIPHRVRRMFVFLTALLRQHKVIIELGVPTILFGLEHINKIKLIPGKLIFGEQRGKIHELFTTEDYFMHPVKFGRLLKSEEGRSFYCEKIQPLLEGSIDVHGVPEGDTNSTVS